jgi:ribose transport system ATP-binding protein
MLRLAGIDKSFGATRAVRDATLEATPGSVLGLVGENGAGKSTLMKIAGGIVPPDKGTVSLYDVPVSGLSPRGMLARGIASVFQELTLVRSLTVAENICLLAPPKRWWGSIDRARLETECAAVLDRYRVSVRPHALVGELPLGLQQMLEVVRAVRREPNVLLLDEATAALGSAEVNWLADVVDAERARGAIVLFISHRWEEIVAFCQRVAIMRNGQLVGVSSVRDISHDAAVEQMTGRRLGATFPAKRRPMAEPLLEARGLEGAALHGVSLKVSKGEILGLGGLVGQGQDELLRSLFGAHQLRSGVIEINGRPRRLRRPADAIREHIAYVPQERKIEGLLLHKSVATNVSLAILRRLSRLGGLIDWRAERTVVRDAIAQLKIRAASAAEPVGNLSGGNQQKVLLQKWLLIRPSLVLLNDVTRGVDIATKMQIYEIVVELAANGVGVVLYSTDAHELVELAHRVLVMADGSVSAELAGADLTAESIVRAALGKKA